MSRALRHRYGRAESSLRRRYGRGLLGWWRAAQRDVRDAQTTTFDSFTKTSAGPLVDRFNRGDL
jgi:hypothetical protein